MNALYDHGRQAFLEGEIDWIADDIKVGLVTSGYSPNLATHQYYSAVVTFVISTPISLTSKTTTAGVANAANITFVAPPVSETVAYLVIYKDTGDDATSRLIALIDTATGLPVSTNGGDITVSWDTGSIKIFRI